MGSAFELKPSAGQTFNHYQPQLLRNMERVATDLAYKAVQENGEIFAEIVIYGGIISVVESSAQLSMVTVDFVAESSCFSYKEEPLPINEFFNCVIDLLQPQPQPQ